MSGQGAGGGTRWWLRGAVLALCCGPGHAAEWQVTVTNPLDRARAGETVSVPWAALAGLEPAQVAVSDGAAPLVDQVLDEDGDGRPDALLFQADFAAGQTRTFTVARGLPAPPPEPARVFARLVPERMDDYAWENDRIAHRVYGAALQRAEKPCSGIDVWVKKVRYPIIDRWYAKGHDSYHRDHGEGLDCYSVSGGRGCGGTGIWRDGRLYVAENFTAHRQIANGPLRTEFELTYPAWDADGARVAEVKRIALDAGANFSRVTSTFTGPGPTLPVVVGVQEHGPGARATLLRAAGSISVWEEAEGHGHRGCAAIVPTAPVTALDEQLGHALAHLEVAPGSPVTYLIGAGWDGSADVPDAAAWTALVADAAARFAQPLVVHVAVR